MKPNLNYFEEIEKCRKILALFEFKLSPPDIIRSDLRDAPIVFERALIAFALRLQGNGLTQIGHVINRNHTTVIYLLKYKNNTAIFRKVPQYNLLCMKIEEYLNLNIQKNRAEYHQQQIQHHQKCIAEIYKKGKR